MAIICDMCEQDITPNDNGLLEDHGFERNMLKVNGATLCCCSDCWMAVGHWVTSDEAKTYCKKYAEEHRELQ